MVFDPWPQTYGTAGRLSLCRFPAANPLNSAVQLLNTPIAHDDIAQVIVHLCSPLDDGVCDEPTETGLTSIVGVETLPQYR